MFLRRGAPSSAGRRRNVPVEHEAIDGESSSSAHRSGGAISAVARSVAPLADDVIGFAGRTGSAGFDLAAHVAAFSVIVLAIGALAVS